MLCGIRELLDLAFGSLHDLHPLVDDYFRESADEDDHADVKDGSCDDEDIESLSRGYHVYEFICHRNEVCELTECNERFLAGQRVDHDDAGHYER